MNQRPTHGKLVRFLPSGRKEVLAEDKPFALLQLLKKNYIQQGVKKESMKITY